MEKNLRVAIGMPNDVLVNEEQSQKKTKDGPLKPLFSHLRWRQHWLSLKPFVNGGAVGVLAGSWACLYYSHSQVFADCRRTPRYHSCTKIFPGAVYIHVFTMSQQLGLYEILRKKAIATNEGMPPTLYQEAACGLTVGACINLPLYLGYFAKQLDTTLPTEQQRWNGRNIFHTGCSAVANRNILLIAKRKMWFDMGMLASYNPSLHYLRESCGFNERRAQLDVGSFFYPLHGQACGLGFDSSGCKCYFSILCYSMQLPSKHIHVAYIKSGHASTSLECALEILKSRGPLGFFSGFSVCLLRAAPPIMTTWLGLERIRELEWSIGL
ncbi:mitochondrial dicarboxylate/tricarboxylate transporter DTC-like [Prunus yedoensis var. nudiflora]|uniref:Mitochondrial dicarboxylate/tricarboxylate transporter DTC-like n=1 Tax=Prunus yedoensis var. nudiflora TaxID=2094558 RepID=A0A314XRS8_PRUYE|nr:mitochondrial dicarboxylate/tricarboxylate transporter DTC-like [Prunus yedoensis var. nudiflora]